MAELSALVLAGGRGTRFWPLSRRHRPKQLLELHGGRCLLRLTLDRLAPLVSAERTWISTTVDLVESVAAQAPEIDRARILGEPIGRNTAPAIAWAVSEMVAAGVEGAIAVLPSDHWVAEPAAFLRALEVARDAALATDSTVTLGVVPRWPETGYGYIELERPPGPELQAERAAGFVEKPDLETARRFQAGGRHLWNAGIFVFRGRSHLSDVATHLPPLARGLEAIRARPDRLSKLYAELPSISIDHGIMEKLDSILCVPLDCGWSDLGSLAALAEILPALESGSRGAGDVIEIDGEGNLLYAESGTVAALGVSDLVVVRTADATVVLSKERAQEVRLLVERLQAEARSELL